MVINKTGGGKSQLLVVSNRLPLSINCTDGDYKATPSGGGLVSSLSGISESIGFRWFGWPGQEIPESDTDKVTNLLAEQDAVPVFFEKELADKHYNGFSSKYYHPAATSSLLPLTRSSQILYYGQYFITSPKCKATANPGGTHTAK